MYLFSILCLLNSKNSDIVILLVYIDDIMLVGNNINESFIGIKATCNNVGITISERKYDLYILCDIDMLGAKIVSTPMYYSSHLSKDEGIVLQDPLEYKTLIRRLIYLNNIIHVLFKSSVDIFLLLMVKSLIIFFDT